MRLNMTAIKGIDALRPDAVVSADRTLTVGGRALDLHVTDHAATEADLWVRDPASGVVAVGDLITLQVPYLDTACPEGWRAALEAVAASEFRMVVPGHGRLMDRAQFDAYRAAFADLTDCAASTRPAAECGAAWSAAVAPLQADGVNQDRVAAYAAGYVERTIRTPEHRTRFCPAA